MVLQIFIFDQIQFLEFINPLVYFLFVLLLPLNMKLPQYMIAAFGYGLILDFFHDTGGAHAAACLTLGFLRNILLVLVYGESYKLKNIKITTSPLNRQLLLLALAIIVHHFVFYTLVIFNFEQMVTILKMTIFISIASFLLGSTILLLIKPKKTK